MYLYGASGHGKVIAEILEDLQWPITAFVDDNCLLESLLDYTILPSSDLRLGADMVISIGNNEVRKRIVEKQSAFNFLTVISPKANISRRSSIGRGTVVMMGATVNSEVAIGEHCIINTNASIDHDCRIADYVHLSPNATLAGNVNVGEGTHIGIGAAVIQGVKIGQWCTIGAGAVVIKDVPDYAVVVGNPARIIKFNG